MLNKFVTKNNKEEIIQRYEEANWLTEKVKIILKENAWKYMQEVNILKKLVSLTIRKYLSMVSDIKGEISNGSHSCKAEELDKTYFLFKSSSL